MTKFKENMINTTKIKSYIGFAIKMQKATFGVDGIKTCRRKYTLYCMMVVWGIIPVKSCAIFVQIKI